MQKFKSNISKEQLNSLLPETFTGDIHVVNTVDEAETAVAYLMRQNILGFDTETRPSFIKGESHTVSLLQLSDAKNCFLFRLNYIDMPQCLIDLLETESVKKIGLSSHDDFKALSKIKENIKPANFIELQSYAPRFGIEEKSLTKIYALIFGKRISKGQRLTNWEAPQLSEKQQLYAALDAYATRRIYIHLEHLKRQGYPLLPPPLAKVTTKQVKDVISKSMNTKKKKSRHTHTRHKENTNTP